MGAIDAGHLDRALELFDSDEHTAHTPLLGSARGRRCTVQRHR
jgi:hypothetical protein